MTHVFECVFIKTVLKFILAFSYLREYILIVSRYIELELLFYLISIYAAPFVTHVISLSVNLRSQPFK